VVFFQKYEFLFAATIPHKSSMAVFCMQQLHAKCMVLDLFVRVFLLRPALITWLRNFYSWIVFSKWLTSSRAEIQAASLGRLGNARSEHQTFHGDAVINIKDTIVSIL